MRFFSSGARAATASLAVAVLLVACGGQQSSTIVPNAASNGTLKTQGLGGGTGNSPTPTPTATPVPAATPGPYCGGSDRDDCYAFRFILPMKASVSGGALTLTPEGDGGLPCLIYGLDDHYVTTVSTDTSVSLPASYTQTDYCAWFEDVGIDTSIKRAGLLPGGGSSPTPVPTATPTATPTAAPTNPPGKLYLVEVAVACQQNSDDRDHHHWGDHDVAHHAARAAAAAVLHFRGDRRDDRDDDHGGNNCQCDPTQDNTVIAVVAGPGTRDGQGHITFPSVNTQTTLKAGVRYYFFLAHYNEEASETPYHL